MKLYVWVRPYSIFRGNSMVFAVADNLRQAKMIAKSGMQYEGLHADGTKRTRYSMPVKLGEPTRIVELPCAEWHQWDAAP